MPVVAILTNIRTQIGARGPDRSTVSPTRRRYSLAGEPLVAISAEVTMPGWGVESLSAGSRLSTRRSYASAVAYDVIEEGFQLLPSFSAPHYSIVLDNYTEHSVQRLISVLGDARPNPYHVRREI
jgi:hypothetical protein